MNDPDLRPGCLFGWWDLPSPTLRQWLVFTLGFVALCVALYFLFSWLGWKGDGGRYRL
jgi:hypothetical protein